MSLIESIPEKLGSSEPWIEKGGVHWLTASALNVRDLAKTMNALQARFVTITAYQLPGTEGMPPIWTGCAAPILVPGPTGGRIAPPTAEVTGHP